MKKEKQLKNKERASLTLEAALVMPIFMFIIIAFIYFLQIIIIHNNLQEAITNVGLEVAKYGYVYDSLLEDNKEDDGKNKDLDPNIKSEDGIADSRLDKFIIKNINSGFFKVALYDNLDLKLIDGSCIKGGFSGIHTYLSSYMEENNTADVVINYKVEIPILFINLDGFQIVQRAKLRGWNGYKPSSKYKKETGEDTKEEKVYITETGSVYHTSRECTHLKLSIKQVRFEKVEKHRNNSGGKYKKCQVCGTDSKIGGLVYITTDGDRYHGNRNCSGLKRTIMKVPLSQVKDRSLCKRCKGKN